MCFTFDDSMQIVFHDMRGQSFKSFVNDVIFFSVLYRVLTESCLSHGPERILIVLALWILSFQELSCLCPLMRLQSLSSLKWSEFASKEIREVSDYTTTSQCQLCLVKHPIMWVYSILWWGTWNDVAWTITAASREKSSSLNR